MGRYDGEYYEDRSPCAPEKHQWGMNGTCFVCRHDKKSLIAQAERLLRCVKDGTFGTYAG